MSEQPKGVPPTSEKSRIRMGVAGWAVVVLAGLGIFLAWNNTSGSRSPLAEPLPESAPFILNAEAVDRGDAILLEWDCRVEREPATVQRSGEGEATNFPKKLFQMSGESIACSLWKRDDGHVVVSILRGDDVLDSVDSDGPSGDLLILSARH